MEKFTHQNTSPENKSRRNFLAWTVSHTVSWMLTLVPSSIGLSPGIFLSLALTWEIEDENMKNKNKPKEDINKTVFIRNDEDVFVNIWVKHDNKILKRQLTETLMGEKIKNSEIILHEKWSYFNIITKLYEDKEAFNIDTSNWRISNFVWWWASFISLYRSVVQLKFDFIGLQKQADEKSDIRKQWLKYILITLGISQLSLFPSSMFYGMTRMIKNMETWDMEDYALKHDISHTWDARTLFMALEVLKYQEKYPNKKIVVITWDAHAAGINYYLYDAQGIREFKKVIYNIVYGIYKLL